MDQTRILDIWANVCSLGSRKNEINILKTVACRAFQRSRCLWATLGALPKSNGKETWLSGIRIYVSPIKYAIITCYQLFNH